MLQTVDTLNMNMQAVLYICRCSTTTPYRTYCVLCRLYHLAKEKNTKQMDETEEKTLTIEKKRKKRNQKI